MNPEGRFWPAPAKLNLMLRVIGQRADGYHDLQTVFQFLETCDTLRFHLTADGRIRSTTNLPGVDETQNLAILAAKLLQQASGCSKGVTIEIRKTLPMGGGLGGGSSNAATALLVLNRLWNTGLSLSDLAQLGLQLGADVPVFVHGRAAWAEGVGEQLQFFQPPEPWYLVIRPDCHVSTAKIFCDSRLTRNAEPITIRDFLAGQNANSCQPLVANSYPEVRRALQWLNEHSEGRLTGTGSCVFGEFGSRQQAEQALRKLPDELQGFVSRGLNRSPLHRQLDDFDGAWPSG